MKVNGSNRFSDIGERRGPHQTTSIGELYFRSGGDLGRLFGHLDHKKKAANKVWLQKSSIAQKTLITKNSFFPKNQRSVTPELSLSSVGSKHRQHRWIRREKYRVFAEYCRVATTGWTLVANAKKGMVRVRARWKCDLRVISFFKAQSIRSNHFFNSCPGFWHRKTEIPHASPALDTPNYIKSPLTISKKGQMV